MASQRKSNIIKIKASMPSRFFNPNEGGSMFPEGPMFQENPMMQGGLTFPLIAGSVMAVFEIINCILLTAVLILTIIALVMLIKYLRRK